MDAVIHLAGGTSKDQPWEAIYTSGINGTYNLFEAARQAGVRKVIYASTTRVLGWREMQQGRRVSPEMPFYPNSLYGVGKATGELLARHFSETYGMSIVCLRIGFFYVDPPLPHDRQDEILRAWCSPGDLAQLVRSCLETDGLGFQVFYAVSNNTRRLWNIDNARQLVGYRPKDNAEQFNPAIRQEREANGNDGNQPAVAVCRYVGGYSGCRGMAKLVRDFRYSKD